MPIYGLTNTPKLFMKLGQIRKGEMQKKVSREGKEYTAPVDLDHFRVTFQPGGYGEQIEAAFLAAYGTTPTELNVRFASANIGEVWDAAYECYKQGGLIASCSTDDTGPHWIFYRDPDDSEVLVRNGSAVGERGRAFYDKPIDISLPIYKNSKGEGVFLEPVGRLQVVIPEVAHIAVGYFVFQPGSPRDIRNISGELGAYEAIAKVYGKSITGIPFILRRRPEEVTVNINGKLSKKLSWVVHLDAGGEWGQRAIETIERLALPDVVEAEYTDIEEELPPEYDESVEQTVNKPAPLPALPATTPVPAPAPAPVETGEDTISPLDEPAVKWAASKSVWNTDTVTAAKNIGQMIKAGKLTDPMNRKAFKDAVKATV